MQLGKQIGVTGIVVRARAEPHCLHLHETGYDKWVDMTSDEFSARSSENADRLPRRRSMGGAHGLGLQVAKLAGKHGRQPRQLIGCVPRVLCPGVMTMR